jgi:LPS-assembly protein
LYPEFEIEVATTLEKDFYSGSSTDRTSAHQIRPYVRYGYLPDVDQDDLPKFDDIDAIEDIHLVTYGVDNYLNKYIKSGEFGEDYNTIFELKVEQSYDLRGDSSAEPFSDVFSELKWNTLTGIYLSYKNYYDVYDNTFNRHTFEGSYTNSRGDYLSLDYSFNEEADIEQINAYFLARITNSWFVGGKIEHSISQDETIEGRGSLTYQATCWSVSFETKYTPDDTAFLVVFNLANIGYPLGINLF